MAVIRPQSSTNETVSIQGGDTVVIGADVMVGTDSGYLLAASGDDITLRNYGFVLAGGQGLSLASGDRLDFINFGEIDGFVALDLRINDSLIQNRGNILGYQDGWRVSESIDNRLINTGFLEAFANGISIGSNSAGNVVQNLGTIRGLGPDGVGIGTASNTTDTLIVNTGEIHGVTAGIILNGDGSEVRNEGLIDGGVWMDGGDKSLTNTGTISKGAGAAAAIFSIGFGDTQDITNRGTIDGGIYFGGAGREVVRNTQVILGDVSLSGGNDAVVNKGTISGIVDLGAGDDVMNGRAGAALRVRAGDGQDRVFGGDGDDVLGGGADEDVISAGAGDDIVVGGLGRDILTGGAGADQFFFETLVDSTLPERDLIRDFQQGEDLIVLWDIFDDFGAVDVNFIGDAAFSGTGEVELRYGARGSQRTEVALDANGDGAAELIFDLAGRFDMALSDFVLEFPIG